MSGIKDQEQLEEMRKRLYSRGFDAPAAKRHELTDAKVDVARSWNSPFPKQVAEVQPVTVPQSVPQHPQVDTMYQAPAPAPQVLPPSFTPPAEVVVDEEPSEEKPKAHRYRKYVFFGSLILFVVGIALAAAFVILGGKRISADNISFNIAGQTTIGSSETMSLQVAITNQNTVGVEEATLVLRYPDGTRTVSDPIKNVYEDRIAIGKLAPGEAKNVPIQVAVFGKENDIKEIKATFEYKVTGSQGTFYKDAEPLKFQITSSPITLQVSSIGKVAAGQPIEVTITAKSNTNKELKDVLVSAEFPNGFTYKESDPKPVYNQNIWKISTLKPGQSVPIKIRGTINGLTQEKFGINFSAGLANTDNQFMVGSTLAEARTEFMIERPFIAVDIAIAGDADRSVVLEPNKPSPVAITIKNTLDEAVYDTRVEVVPTGNAFSPASIDAKKGFYDSNKNVIRWDVTNNPDFTQIKPGDSKRIDFIVNPIKSNNTASFEVTVNVYARRVAEASAQEQLIGTVTAAGKYASAGKIGGQASFMTGPVPPQVGQATKYLISLVAEAGGNNMTNTKVQTQLPTYVEWQNDYSGPGVVDYNPVTKNISWTVGDVSSGARKELTFSVSILPSVSQVGTTPILVNGLTLTATDRFTGTPINTEGREVTTELSREAGYKDGNGEVVK
jgi:Domain of unknown function DUF11